MRLLSPIGGYLLKPPAQKAATKHWLKLEVISAHHVPKVGEGRVQHDAVPWYQHAPALNTKSAAPNARAPDDLYLVATLLGGGADACLLSARPAAASKDEAAVDEAAALGQGQRRLQSKAVSSNGLQAVFNQPFYVRTSSPQLTVLHVAVHAAAHGVRGGVTGDAVGPAVAYAALPLGALRFGCRVFQLCAPDCGRTSMPNASPLVVPQLAALVASCRVALQRLLAALCALETLRVGTERAAAPLRAHSWRPLVYRVQSLLEPGYRQTGWDSPTSRSQRVLCSWGAAV